MITVTQISDPHFSVPGHRSHLGFGYDTDDAWRQVAAHAYGRGVATDLTVITGDLVDNGREDEYRVAAHHLAEIPTPVNALSGNHDLQVPLEAGLSGGALTMERSQLHGPWLFLFADSNFEGRSLNENGQLVDDADRRATNGRLGPREIEWIRAEIKASQADHVWLWMHHPPAMAGDTAHFDNPAFTDEVLQLLDNEPSIRGIGAGHVHTELEQLVRGRRLFLCPSLTINIDVVAWTTLPPGYRTYEFHDDGSVTSECHFVDGPDWPRNPVPSSVADYYRGVS